MKKSGMWKCVLVVLIALLLAGCAVRQADLTVISTKNVNLDKVDLDTCPHTEGVTGKDSAFVFLFIPFGAPHLEDAIDDALEKGGGDIMTDAVISNSSFWFIVGVNTLEVKGNVVKTRGVAQ